MQQNQDIGAVSIPNSVSFRHWKSEAAEKPKKEKLPKIILIHSHQGDKSI